jgi:hypothetical protein
MNQAPAIATLQAPTLASSPRATPARRAAPAPAPAPGEDPDSLQDCVRIWTRVRGLDAAFWLGLPMRRSAAAAGPELAGALGAGPAPYARIALEAERTLSLGVGGASAPALLLLAAVALDRCNGAEAAVELARTACRLAARTCQAGAVYALYAALIAPRAGELHHAVSTLAGLCQDDAPAQLAALGLAGAGFAAGMPLAELVRGLDLALARPAPDAAGRAAALELAGRTRLLRGLLAPHASVLSPCCDGAAQQEEQQQRFGHWLTRLQAAWYVGDAALARQAANRAAALANPLTPSADLACYRLFGALAVAHAPAALDALRRHCAALNVLAERCPAAAAMAELVSALIDYRAGDTMAALRGFERAAASATRRKQHWLASLAAEQAALQAVDAGLATAARHYRRQALAACLEWGARGRAEALCRAWGETLPAPQPPAAAPAARGDCIELGASIAHEVNQPLAAIALHAAAARKWLRRGEPDVERALASLSLISAAGRQAGDIVRSVRRLAARQDSEFEQVEVDAALAEALLVLERPLRRHGIALDTAFGLGGCAIEASRAQIQQVATNLVLNAIEALAGASPDCGERRIQVSTYRYNEDMVEIAVADNGPGVAPAARAHIFEQLYSTKPGNTGMGLAISLAIARAHGGALALEDCMPHGARFCLRLPLRPPVTA